MNIAIIDADLLSSGNHRFPNLCSMKISSYYKKLGHVVTLKLNYDNLENFDKVFISKVFETTSVPEEILNLDNVEYGGTGFFYDKAPDLPEEIEHIMPDYDLYVDWVNSMIEKGSAKKEFEYYINYSIGFTTRGCFRKCSFCVNKKYDKVAFNANISEFLNKDRKKICLLDDNILGYKNWKEILMNIKESNKYFQFKQGMDIRLMTDEKAKILTQCKYLGDFIFAFDYIKDRKLIENKLHIWKSYCKKHTKLYVLCAYDEREKSKDTDIRNQSYDLEFWEKDIIDTFERIFILGKYDCTPYLMRYKEYEKSPFRGIYINLAAWCNQPHLFKRMSFKSFCIEKGMNYKIYKQYKNDYNKYLSDGYKKGAPWRYLDEFEKNYPEIVDKYFNITYSELSYVNNNQIK
jgi:hypothetical protein